MNFKKYLALFLSAVILLSVFTACGADDSATSTDDSISSNDMATEPSDDSANNGSSDTSYLLDVSTERPETSDNSGISSPSDTSDNIDNSVADESPDASEPSTIPDIDDSKNDDREYAQQALDEIMEYCIGLMAFICYNYGNDCLDAYLEYDEDVTFILKNVKINTTLNYNEEIGAGLSVVYEDGEEVEAISFEFLVDSYGYEQFALASLPSDAPELLRAFEHFNIPANNLSSLNFTPEQFLELDKESVDIFMDAINATRKYMVYLPPVNEYALERTKDICALLAYRDAIDCIERCVFDTISKGPIVSFIRFLTEYNYSEEYGCSIGTVNVDGVSLNAYMLEISFGTVDGSSYAYIPVGSPEISALCEVFNISENELHKVDITCLDIVNMKEEKIDAVVALVEAIVVLDNELPQ